MSKQHTLQTQYGSYTLLKKIYASSSIQMYLSLKELKNKSRKFFILKTLNKEKGCQQESIDSFYSEGEIITSLSHHHIIRGYEFGTGSIENTDIEYIAMDFIPGKSLAQVFQQTPKVPLPVEITCQVIQALSTALAYAHSYHDPVTGVPRAIIHRDISPDNILLGYNGDIVLIDFGISISEANPIQPEIIRGKPGYMSPEQRKRETLSPLSDIYSLGVVFWECLTGKRMVPKGDKGQTNNERIAHIPSPVHPSEENLSAPRILGDICMKCLEITPSERLQSAEDILHILNNQNHFSVHGSPVIRDYMGKIFADEIQQERSTLVTYLEQDHTLPSQPVSPVSSDATEEEETTSRCTLADTGITLDDIDSHNDDQHEHTLQVSALNESTMDIYTSQAQEDVQEAEETTQPCAEETTNGVEQTLEQTEDGQQIVLDIDIEEQTMALTSSAPVAPLQADIDFEEESTIALSQQQAGADRTLEMTSPVIRQAEKPLDIPVASEDITMTA
ncbi:serine/threonine protein kinase [Desulfogranum japonicum]|uniref:serine/threonine protein kinase n=1 Tax=Desulfogranum japonicum TaxID=231447 RepID=UPI00040FA429|nr:serine/threonine-protein kinase [Desulfogranum japonicum]